MDPAVEQLLQQLREPHLPAPPGWWPPAPGWWLLALLVIAIAAWFYMRWRRVQPHSTTEHWRDSALRELQSLCDKPRDSELQRSEVLAGVSSLLRRTAIAAVGRSNSAALTGTAWLQLLDNLSGSTRFSQGDGKLLSLQPYQRPGSVAADQLESLLELARETIKRAGPE